MKTSEKIDTIAGAFLKAQKNINSVIKDSNNPFFKSKYADLTSVIEACKDKLNHEGIGVLQPTGIDELGVQYVETILMHESGEWFSSKTPIVSKDPQNPQALGSAITYAKRYGLQSMVLLPAEDDDGNAASTRGDSVTSQFSDEENRKAQEDIKRTEEALSRCEVCGTTGLLDTVVNYSRSTYGKTLCWKDQQVEKLRLAKLEGGAK